jgi:hypothetical protein
MSSLEGIKRREYAIACYVMCERFSLKKENYAWAFCPLFKENLLKIKNEYLSIFIYFFRLGYSRNQSAPMSPRSYSAYSNAYGSSASTYGVPSPGFLNG